jgi:hypothetical protein
LTEAAYGVTKISATVDQSRSTDPELIIRVER